MRTPVSESVAPAPLCLRVEDADVRYRVYEDRALSLREVLRTRRRPATVVHALKGIDLEVDVGESVGIVGTNGSGKSTLLRAIAGVQPLNGGRIRIRGDAHLLGVGAAFKPLLSGYRNIYLGGLAMGMSRSEIEARLPEVLEFTELTDAIRRPLNTYSAGMRSRLAFAIATLKVPDVLLVDEALAVGDRLFRARSLEKLSEFRDQAAAVLLVTHNLNEIRKTCTRAVWIERGELLADGPVPDVLAEYESFRS